MSGVAKLSSAGCEGGKNSTARAVPPQCFISTGAGAPSFTETLIFFIPMLVQTVMSIVWFRLDATKTRTELPTASHAAAQKASSKKILRRVRAERLMSVGVYEGVEVPSIRGCVTHAIEGLCSQLGVTFHRHLLRAEVFADNPRQLKHRHLRLAKHGQQLGVGVDVALVGGVLQVVGLDVVP